MQSECDLIPPCMQRSADKFPPPFTRCHTHELPEQTCEMGLIVQPAIERDLGKGVTGRQHHLLCALDASACNIGERGLAECCLEHSKEMPSAHSGEQSEIGAPDRLIKIFLDVSYQTFCLPTRQPAAKYTLGLRFVVSLHTCSQQRRRSGQAYLRTLTIKLNLGLRDGEQLQQSRCQRNLTLLALFMRLGGQLGINAHQALSACDRLGISIHMLKMIVRIRVNAK